jgi:hypothetical protein
MVEMCLLAVEAHFLLLKPIFTTRWDCFRIRKSGRPFKDYVADRSIGPFCKAECFWCKKVGHILEHCSSTSCGEANDYSRSGDQRSAGCEGYPRSGSPAGKYNPDASKSLSTTRVCAIAMPSSDNMQVELACVAPGAFFVLHVLPDSGAARTVLRMVPPGAVLMPSSTRLIAANSEQLWNLGKLEFMAMAPGEAPDTISAVVSPDLAGPALLSRQDMVSLGILSQNFPAVQRGASQELIAAIDPIKAYFNEETGPPAEAELAAAESELAPPTNSTTPEAIKKTID